MLVQFLCLSRSSRPRCQAGNSLSSPAALSEQLQTHAWQSRAFEQTFGLKTANYLLEEKSQQLRHNNQPLKI